MPALVSEPKTKTLSITNSTHSTVEPTNHQREIPFHKCKAKNTHAGTVHSRLKTRLIKRDRRRPPLFFLFFIPKSPSLFKKNGENLSVFPVKCNCYLFNLYTLNCTPCGIYIATIGLDVCSYLKVVSLSACKL